MKFLFGIIAFCIFQLFSFLFVKSETSLSDIYKSKDCHPILCFPKVFEFVHGESDEKQESSKRTKFFQESIGENELDAIKPYDEKMIVYAVLDPFLMKNIATAFESKELENVWDTAKYKTVYYEDNFKRLEQLFVYIGSGPYTRHHEHLFFSKAMCPNEEASFVHMRVSPLVLYICSTLFDVSKKTTLKNSEIFIFPIMAVKNYEMALKLETALIYALQHVVVNFRPSTVQINDKERHFLAHYAIECVFRFLKDELKNIKYDHQVTPEFPMHVMHSFGYYDTDNVVPRELVYQGKSIYRYPLKEFKMSSGQTVSDLSPTVRLPFGKSGFDYKLPDKRTQSDVSKQLDNIVKIIFEFSETNVFKCYHKEKKGIKEENKKSLKVFIGELYYVLHACIKCPNGILVSDYEVELNFDLLRRVQAKFEYLSLFVLYVDNKEKDKTIYTDWDPNTENGNVDKKAIPEQDFPTDFEDRFNRAQQLFEDISNQEKLQDYEDMLNAEKNQNDEEDDPDDDVDPKNLVNLSGADADAMECDAD